MSIEAVIKCSDIKVSLSFYTELLDFTVSQAPDSDPESFLSMYAFLERQGSFLHLSQHAGDGVFGNAIYIRVENIDILYEQFLKNGLDAQENSANASVSIKPVEQTWGMKEFSVRDPDGNRITFGHSL